MSEHKDVDVGKKTLSVYYMSIFTPEVRTKCPACGEVFKGRGEVAEITEIVNVHTYENIALDSKLANVAKAEVNKFLATMSCPNCSLSQEDYQQIVHW